MTDSTHPAASGWVAVVVGLGLALSGWYVMSHGTGPFAPFGWILLAAGLLSVVANGAVLVPEFGRGYAAMLDGTHPEGIQAPPPMAISHYLMRAFVTGET